MKALKLFTVALITAAPLSVLPAAAQSVGEQTGVNAVLGVSPSTTDFATQAAVSGMFEIQSSELALERGDAATKAFAQQMITAHRKASEELKGLVASANINVTLPATLDSAHQETMDDLRKLQGAEFNEEYIDEQVDAHEDAISLFERYAEGGDNAALKAWAAKTLPELKHHLDMAKKLDK